MNLVFKVFSFVIVSPCFDSVHLFHLFLGFLCFVLVSPVYQFFLFMSLFSVVCLSWTPLFLFPFLESLGFFYVFCFACLENQTLQRDSTIKLSLSISVSLGINRRRGYVIIN